MVENLIREKGRNFHIGCNRYKDKLLRHKKNVTMTIGHAFRNVAELASGKFPATKHPSFNKIFDVKVFNPECKASPELAQKYGKTIGTTAKLSVCKV